MGTYASDDSDDEGSVVSVVRHGELASVVERRATQIRHVLRDGPPDSEEDTPPAVRVRRGDLDPFALQRRASAGTSSRVDAGRGPSRLSKRGEKHANRDRHVVWRDERTTEGDPEGFGSRQRDAYGRRRRSIPESSPPRYRDAYGDAYVAETVTDVHHYASPTLLAAPELPEPGRVASLARRYEDPRFFDPELIPDVPEFRLGVERRSRSPAGFALNAHASAQSGVDAAREALDDVARDLRDAHERSAEKMRALAQAMDARENRLAESALALRDVQRRLTGVLAAVDGDEAGSVDLEALERADLDARGAALRAAAAEKAAELRAKNERDRREAEARAARARAEAEAAARAEAETARARAARPSAAAARETNDATRVFVSRERPESPPREASAATPESRLGTRSAAPASRGAENPDPEPNLEPKPPSLSRTRVSRVPSALAKSPSELIVTTPRTMAKGRDRDERLGAAKRTPSPSVPSALTRARAVSPPPRALGTAAPAEQTPAIPRERLVERFPEKTPSARAARVPAGALALSRTRQAGATVSAMKPPSFDGKEAGAKEAGAGSAAGLTRAGRRVGPTSPGTRLNASPGPEPPRNRRGTAAEPPGGVPGAAPAPRDGVSLGVPGADVLGASDEKRPGESRGGLSRTRALGGETPTAASGATSGVSRRPVDPRAAAVARSRLARTRR